MPERTVVVGIDGSSSALRAARWAAAEASRRSARLRLVYCDVQSIVMVPDMPGVGLTESFLESVRRQGEGWLQQAREAAEAAQPGIQVDVDFHSHPPANVFIEESRTAALVVLGSRGLGGFTGLLVGSVAVAVSTHASCPVAVVRGSKAVLGDEAVVVGVDGSPGSTAAVGYAFEAAARWEVPLRAVHTWHSISVDEASARRGADGGWAILQIDEERLLAESLAGWSEKYPDVVVQRFVPLDKPARALLEHANRAQLVVVGARGRGGFTGLLLGSTSQHLVQHSPCPVVIAR